MPDWPSAGGPDHGGLAAPEGGLPQHQAVQLGARPQTRGQGPGHPLHFAAGRLPRPGIGPVGEGHRRQQFGHQRRELGPGPAKLLQGQRHVLPGGEGGDQV